MESLRPILGLTLRPVEPDTPVNVQYTSGTTGLPKGCVLPHTYWTRLAGSLITEFPRLTHKDILLTAQPCHYVDPQWNIVAGLLSGAEVVVLDGFHPTTFWNAVREHNVTYFYCLGAMPGLLLKQPRDARDRDHVVRLVQCSGIPPALHAELEHRWGVPWHEAFGMTETGADLRVTDADHDELVGTGCVGGPLPDREVRVVDGELRLRGPGMMSGYHAVDNPFDDGWFRTGDLARLDQAGRVYLVGRLKDMIRRSGENVAAREVEDVLLTHPDVRLVAVTSVPDDLRGEEVKAHVVGIRDPDALAAYCLERLAPFKVPRYWEFRDDLPRTPSERVAKHQLNEQTAATYDRVNGRWSA
ncbi:AMP-binding protein [Actinophytocola oryzae]|uniref:Crotonobetaine/carnitine-CoA ligase n=1 Tax=Actinophytocola oryzae TaxID=502181 RepID=A0A4R7V2X0_9PSEU|nr:crotonobetaine/carnitine-CoA ligase [Actinophytocola oryzae]